MPKRSRSPQKLSRFRSLAEHLSLHEDLAGRMDATRMKSVVARRQGLLTQALGDRPDPNLNRRMKPVWDAMVASQLPVRLVYQLARAYARRAGEAQDAGGVGQ